MELLKVEAALETDLMGRALELTDSMLMPFLGKTRNH